MTVPTCRKWAAPSWLSSFPLVEELTNDSASHVACRPKRKRENTYILGYGMYTPKQERSVEESLHSREGGEIEKRPPPPPSGNVLYNLRGAKA